MKTFHAEQWVIVLLTAIVLLLGIDWGLPCAERVEILFHGTPVSDTLVTLIDQSADSYFTTREDVDRAAAMQIRNGESPIFWEPPPPPANLEMNDKLGIVRRYLLGSCSPDERQSFVALARMKPAEGDFNLHGFVYGGSFLYPLGMALFVLQKISLLSLEPYAGYYVREFDDVRLMYMIGRMMSVLSFLGILVLLARFGNALGGRRIGTVAMITWALSTQPLNQSLIAKPHVWTAFWALSAVFFLYRHLACARRRDLIASAVSLGIAIGSSFVAALVFLIYPLLLLRSGSHGRSFRRLGLVGILVVATYCATNPYVLVDPSSYQVTLFRHGAVAGYGFAVPSVGKGLTFLRDFFVRGYAFPLGLLGLLSAAGLLVRGESFWRRSVVMWIVGLLVLAFLTGVSHHGLFLGAILCLFSGIGFDRLCSWGQRRRRLLGRTVQAAIFLPGLCFAALFAHDVIRDDAWIDPTRRWVQTASVAAGVSIGIIHHPEPQDVPPIPVLSSAIVNLDTCSDRSCAPQYVVIGNNLSERRLWKNHPLREDYLLSRTLGYRESYDWLLALRTRSEAHVAAWVYELGP